jgi:hypothetical protein
MQKISRIYVHRSTKVHSGSIQKSLHGQFCHRDQRRIGRVQYDNGKK